MGLYAVNRNDKEMTKMPPATSREIGARECFGLQEWIAKNPDWLCQDDGEEREKLRIIQTEADNDELDRFPAGAGFPGKSSADWGWVQHMHASFNATGRAAVVLDTGAASCGSGNAGTNKEKTVRQWFVDHDFIESVLYLSENLFYSTTAPGIVLFLNKIKPRPDRARSSSLTPARSSKKATPMNFILDEGIQRIADTLIEWKEAEKLSRIVDHAELVKNDYNISPSRHIHTSDAETSHANAYFLCHPQRTQRPHLQLPSLPHCRQPRTPCRHKTGGQGMTPRNCLSGNRLYRALHSRLISGK